MYSHSYHITTPTPHHYTSLAAQQHAIHYTTPHYTTLHAAAEPCGPLPSALWPSHPSLSPLLSPLTAPARRDVRGVARKERAPEGERQGHGHRRDTEGYGQRHLCNCICTRMAGASEERVAVGRVQGREYSGEHRKCMYMGTGNGNGRF